MRLLILLFTFMLGTSNAQKWGPTGHRVVGDVAAEYLSPKARKAVDKILEGESLAIASTWMDEIRSDPKWDYTESWHWVTIPPGKTYAETKKNPDGDLIRALRSTIAELKQGHLSHIEEQQKVKMLIHLVGDIHQPLHVGTGKDRGGNDVKVEWFYERSNLHRVWDSGMIDQTKLSYTELANSIDHVTRKQIRRWQHSGIPDWTRESMQLRDKVYNLPDDKNLSYKYMYNHYDIVQKRLLQAGIRLAGILNDIYG